MLALLLPPIVADASPTTNQKSAGGVEPPGPPGGILQQTRAHASIILRDGGESATTLSGFSDAQVMDLLHYGRAQRPGMRLEVLSPQAERDKDLDERILRFQEIAKWKPVEPTIAVSFTESGMPLVDGVEFSMEQLQVLLAAVRQRQPGIVLLLVGERPSLVKNSHHAIRCASRAGINSIRFAQEENAPSKNNKAEPAGAGQPATRSVDKPEGGDKPQPEAEGRDR